jgi:hypothetical protein
VGWGGVTVLLHTKQGLSPCTAAASVDGCVVASQQIGHGSGWGGQAWCGHSAQQLLYSVSPASAKWVLHGDKHTAGAQRTAAGPACIKLGSNCTAPAPVDKAAPIQVICKKQKVGQVSTHSSSWVRIGQAQYHAHHTSQHLMEGLRCFLSRSEAVCSCSELVCACVWEDVACAQYPCTLCSCVLPD